MLAASQDVLRPSVAGTCRIASAAASGVSPYPASRSIDTGTDTAAVIRATRPVTVSNGTSSPSAYPSADATAALLVATAGEPFAMATSQALNRTSGSPFL